MNEKYALDPKAIENYKDLKYIVEKFGFTEGRFLLRYPKYWKKMLNEHLINLDLKDIEIAKINEILVKYEQNFIRAALDYTPSNKWETNATLQKHQGNINDIIGLSTETMIHPEVINDKIPDSRGIIIRGSAKNLVMVAKPLLQESEEIFIVDPYLTLEHESYLSFFRELIKATSNQRISFNIFSNAKHFRSTTPPQKIAEDTFLRILQPTQSITFTSLIDDKKLMHKRLMFSIKGALSFDKGFRVSKEDVSIEVSAKTIHQNFLDLYLSNHHNLQIQDHFFCPAK